ncbi:hypothetical protein [Bradyrhizobium sp.]|jgi:hypothetical protein|uniref:hypothetical protein n=1 Tax=Bradyrhizobium sp. TaxID=376 RepID=UPI003BB21D9A
MPNGRAVIPDRERDKAAVKTIGIGEDRRSPRKNLDEVSILVAEARSTLIVIRTGTRIQIKRRRFETEPARLFGPRISLGLAHMKNMVEASALVPTAALASFAAARCDLKIVRLGDCATWRLDEVAIWVDKKARTPLALSLLNMPIRP